MQMITIFSPQAMLVSGRLQGRPALPVLRESCIWGCWHRFQHCWSSQFAPCMPFCMHCQWWSIHHPLHSLCPGPSEHGIKRPIFWFRNFFNDQLLQPCRRNRIAATTANCNQIYHSCPATVTEPFTTTYASCAAAAVSCCLGRQLWHTKQPQRTSVLCSLLCSTQAREVDAAGSVIIEPSFSHSNVEASNSVNCWWMMPLWMTWLAWDIEPWWAAFLWRYVLERDAAIMPVLGGPAIKLAIFLPLRYHTEVDKLKLKLNWLSLEIMEFSFKYLRCNDSHFRMGALECHQSQMVDTFE